MDSKKFSILVATMNRPQAIDNLLCSIEKQTFLPQEMVLVDQSQNNHTKDICERYAVRLKARGQNFKYIRQEAPSLVKARNRGVDESTGHIICFVDDDLILDPKYFERIAFYFKDPAIGGVTGNVYVEQAPAGFKWEIRKLLMRFFLLNNFNGRLTASTFGYPIFEREVDRVQEVDLFGGYSMNYRRGFVLTNRPDEWFNGYGFREDVDLSYRISRQAKMIIVPDAKFVHDVSTINRLDTGALKKMQFKNHLYLFRKFRKYGAFSWVLFWHSLFGIIVLDFLEFLTHLSKAKWQVFTANFSAMRRMFE